MKLRLRFKMFYFVAMYTKRIMAEITLIFKMFCLRESTN